MKNKEFLSSILILLTFAWLVAFFFAWGAMSVLENHVVAVTITEKNGNDYE